MTKSDAIEAVKNYGYSASHPAGGSMTLQVKVVSFCPRKERRFVEFNGDCSANTDWNIEYLGER